MAETLRIDIGANIKPLQDGLNSAKTNIKNFATGASAGITKLADASALAGTNAEYLSSSFSGAIGPIGIVASAIAILGTELLQYKSIAEKAAETQKATNLEIQKSIAGTAGEAAELQSLVSIATNETLSREARAEAANRLNKLYPDTFRNYNFEKGDLAQLKKLTDDLVISIQAHAKAKAIQNQIDASANRVLELQNQRLDKNLGFFGKLKIALLSAGNASAAFSDGVTSAVDNLSDSLSEEDKIQKDLAKQLNAVNTQLANNGDLYKDPKTKDAIKGRTKAIKELAETIIKLKTAFGIENNSQTRLDAFNGPTVKGKAIGTPLVTNFSADFLQAQAEFLKLQETAKTVSDIFSNTLGPAISEAFTAAIEGSQSFGQAFGSALKRIFAQLTATLIKAAALAAILNITGVSKLGFLGSFSDILKGGKGFAGGGVASGPSTGYLALLHGKETIFNESQMKALAGLISGGGQQTFIADNKLSGEDLYTSFIRVAQRRGRNF